MEFTKMHGAGNDYVYVDARAMPDRDWNSLSRAISDRHFGVGGDGLILVMDSDVADLRMRMFNSDGSEGAMCGNGIRCFAKYAIERGIVSSSAEQVTVDTMAGVRTIVPHYAGATVHSARVSMGAPRLDPSESLSILTQPSPARAAPSSTTPSSRAISAFSSPSFPWATPMR